MKTKVFASLGIVIITGVGVAWYFNLHDGTETFTTTLSPTLTAAINECDSITEKAAQNLVAVVEFQKLEIIGRKARVYKQCMSDHGYRENPGWESYASLASKSKASAEKISVDEAVENLRRADMGLLVTPAHHPVYWVQNKKQTASD